LLSNEESKRGLVEKFFEVERGKLNSKGFTLVELLAVLVILGILAGIAIPSVFHLIEKAEADACHASTAEIERMYETYLAIESIDHTDMRFSQFLAVHVENGGSNHGEVNYVDGRVQCSIHSNAEEHEDDQGDEEEGVPFL
jgi:prepilin-type N-terminal cleavage/methylation domain-containing protein